MYIHLLHLFHLCTKRVHINFGKKYWYTTNLSLLTFKSPTLNKINLYDIIFEIAVQVHDAHQQFATAEGTKAIMH